MANNLSGMFSLKPLLILTIIGLVVGLSAAILFALPNTASKTIALATAALSGTALLFGVQLGLELRGSEDSDFVSVEFTVDQAKPSVRQSEYLHGGLSVLRLHYEEGASAWLAQNSPAAFSNRERLTRDFALAEILLFFAQQEFDWQLVMTSYKGSGFTLETARPVSKPSDCTQISRADFTAALRKAGNVLASFDSPLFPNRLVCLPPGTKIIPRDNSLTLSNPFGHLQFTVEQSPGIVSLDPKSNAPSPTLPNGEPQFETHLIGIRIVNHQTALYSQHRYAAKQAAWRKRVISGLHSWFEQQSPADRTNR